MIIRITGPAEVVFADPAAGDRRSAIRALDGAESAGVCSDYLDDEFADLGLAGGTVRLSYDAAGGRFWVTTEYTSPGELTAAQLGRLRADTLGQWSDGIGEGCFDDLAGRLGVTIDLSPPGHDGAVRVEQSGGGRPRGPKSGLARAARDGDLASVRAHLSRGADLEARLQGHTPLHLAVLYGHADAALELIERGADIHARDPLGGDPLLQTATSNKLADADAARVARALLERGVSVHGPRGPDADPRVGEYTPLYMAKNRKKTKLAAVLKAFGATK